jgi:16S rRNA (cytidine1402-2'-O)-methyltransferase
MSHHKSHQASADGEPAPAANSANETSRLAQHVAAEITHRLAAPLPGGLYLIATPIGNLADITLRALVVLAQADQVYCEDTRQSLKILQRFGIRQKLDTYHEHNADRMRPRILAQLEAGRSIALMSDAGTPLISDPGFKLVRDAAEAGAGVHAIPGPSAVLAGLVASGLPTDSFHFAGFLPAKKGARQSRIAALATVPGTLVLFEAATRAGALLSELAAALGARPAALARELTKINETVWRGNLDALAEQANQADLKGEIVILVGAGAVREFSDADILEALVPELLTGSVRDVSAGIALRLGVPKSRVYDLAIAFQSGKLQIDSEPTATRSTLRDPVDHETPEG